MLVLEIIFILTVIGGCTAWEALQNHLAEARDRNQRAQRAAMRQRYVALAPDSANAFERLGDALRENDDLAGALAAYENALALMERQDATTLSGAGWLSGSGIQTKIRLVRLEFAEAENPARFGQTMRTRQAVCRTCGALGKPQAIDCAQCGAALPVDHLLDTWQHEGIRRSLVKEILHALMIFGTICISLYGCSALSFEVRGIVAFSAFAVVSMKVLKKIGSG